MIDAGRTEKVMATCAYAGKAGNTVICDYLGITGKVRDCTSRVCTEYKLGKGARDAETVN